MAQTRTGRAQPLRAPLSTCASGLGAGTGVLTTDGEIPAEFLLPGDRVITRDAGAVPLSGIVTRRVPAAQVVRLRPSAVDPEGKGRDLLLSAGQRLFLSDWRARAIFGRPQIVVEAARLADGAYIARHEGRAPVTLFQLIFADRQHILYLGDMRVMAASTTLAPV